MPKLSIRTTFFHLYGMQELAQAKPPATTDIQTADQRFDPSHATFAQMKALWFANSRYTTEFTAAYANRDNSFIAETDSTITESHDWDFEWSLNLVEAIALTGNNTLRVGGFYNRWVAPYGKRFYAGRRCDLSTFAGVVVDEHRFGRLLLDGGLRWQRTYMNEYGAYNIDGTAKGFGKVPPVTDTWEPSILNWSLGASFAASPVLTLNANASAGTIRSRPGTLTSDLADPDDEFRFKLDAGFQARLRNAGLFTLTGFYVKQDNAIILSGATQKVDDRIHELYENRDQDQTGVEMELRSTSLWKMGNVFFNIAVMNNRAEIGGDMKKDEEKPDVVMGGGVSLSRNGYDLNIFVKSMSPYESARFAASGLPEPLGDFTTLNLTAGKSFGGRLRTRAYIEATNLTDQEYSTVVGYPDYGRRITVGVRQTFQ